MGGTQDNEGDNESLLSDENAVVEDETKELPEDYEKKYDEDKKLKDGKPISKWDYYNN